ncbi:MAG: holo-ACP synthase [Phycisphaerales bacterium]
MPDLVHGVDLVEVARFARSLDEHAGGFARRVFTPGELAYADARPRRRTEHLAARFAAKEAAMKALGTGWSGGVGFCDIEVVREGDAGPALALHAGAAAAADRLGITRWALSLSHTDTHAIASVIGWRG